MERSIPFHTDLNVGVRAGRAFVRIEFPDSNGSSVRPFAIMDSGAPFSVLPYSFWHDQNISWQLLGTQLLRHGKLHADALYWQGVPCQLGEVQAQLMDEATASRTRLLTIRAKFPIAKSLTHFELEPILGYNFLVDNSLTLTMKGIAGRLEGFLMVD